MAKKKGLQALMVLDKDADNLKKLIKNSDKSSNSISLLEEVRKAVVVPKSKLPPDVVIMNSTVRILDVSEKERLIYTIVFPWDADIDNNRISVLAPVGTALLGYRKGDIIDWMVPSGIRRLKIEEVNQPA